MEEGLGMYHHLTVTSEAGCALISLDYQGKSANVLSQAMIEEISAALKTLEAQKDISGFILRSAKPSGFVFGADITEFETLSSAEEVIHLQKNAMAGAQCRACYIL